MWTNSIRIWVSCDRSVEVDFWEVCACAEIGADQTVVEMEVEVRVDDKLRMLS